LKRITGFLAGLLIAIATSAHAQGSMAVKAGFSYGNVSNSGVLPGTPSARDGFAIGVGLGNFKSLIGFGAEALYAQRGVENSSSAGKRRTDYIDVPLYLRGSLPAPAVTARGRSSC